MRIPSIDNTITAAVFAEISSRALALRVSLNLPLEFNCRLIVGDVASSGQTPSIWVVVLDGCGLESLASIREAAHEAPCVGVASRPDDRSYTEMRSWIGEIVPAKDIEISFQSTIRRVFDGAMRERVCQILRDPHTHDSDHRRLRDALVRSILVGERMVSVQELASACHCDPSTLRRWWRRSSLLETPQTFVGFQAAKRVRDLVPGPAWGGRLLSRGIVNLSRCPPDSVDETQCKLLSRIPVSS